MSRVAITIDNKSALIEIFIWLCLVSSILTVLIRLIIKRYVLQKFNLDDILVLASLLAASAQSIVVSVATANGLGQRLVSLTSSQIASQLKAQYTSDILSITTYFFAKLSLIAFLRSLTPQKSDRRLCLILGSVVVIWAVTSVVATAFQCHLPRPWDFVHGSCLDRRALADYIAIMNILTDVGLISLPIVIVTRLKVVMRKKIILSFVFFGRTSIIAAVGCELIYLNRMLKDPSFDAWPVAICNQIAQCLSILTACTFYLKPFIDSLESGFIRAGDLRRQHVAGFGYSPENAISGSDSNKSPFSSSSRKTKQSKQHQSGEVELRGIRNHHTDGLGHSTLIHSETPDWDANSQSHILRTTTLIIGDNSQ